ncbi:MAG: nuclear transport factor 2 family protein [Longimicrobiales bacterium]
MTPGTGGSGPRPGRRPSAGLLGVATPVCLALGAPGCGGTGGTGGGPAEGREAVAPTAADTAAVVADVRTALEAYQVAVDARDEEAIRAAYLPDGRFVWMEDGSVRYRSADAVLEALAAFPADVRLRTVYSGLEVVLLAPGAAHAWAGFTTTVGEGPGGYSFGGILSWVLVTDEDGRWRIAGGHTSSTRSRAGG